MNDSKQNNSNNNNVDGKSVQFRTFRLPKNKWSNSSQSVNKKETESLQMVNENPPEQKNKNSMKVADKLEALKVTTERPSSSNYIPTSSSCTDSQKTPSIIHSICGFNSSEQNINQNDNEQHRSLIFSGKGSKENRSEIKAVILPHSQPQILSVDAYVNASEEKQKSLTVTKCSGTDSQSQQPDTEPDTRDRTDSHHQDWLNNLKSRQKYREFCTPPTSPEAGTHKQDPATNLHLFQKQHSYTSTNKETLTRDYYAQEDNTNMQESTHVQEGLNYLKTNKSVSERNAKLDIDGISAEKNVTTMQEESHLKYNNLSHGQQQTSVRSDEKLSAREHGQEYHTSRTTYTASTYSCSQEEQFAFATRFMNFHSNSHMSAQTDPAQPSSAVCVPKQFAQLTADSSSHEVALAASACKQQVCSILTHLQQERETAEGDTALLHSLEQLDTVFQQAWCSPVHGPQLVHTLSTVLRQQGGLDTLIASGSMAPANSHVRRRCVRLLHRCLSVENRDYVIAHGHMMGSVVRAACEAQGGEAVCEAVGVLDSLCRHSEHACRQVLRYGALDTLIGQCQRMNVVALRACVVALINLCLYGDRHTQITLLEENVLGWLFPMAVHADNDIRYMALLCAAVMYVHREAERAPLYTEMYGLMEKFLEENSALTFVHRLRADTVGQPSSWLQRLLPLLRTECRPSQQMAAFHFLMEASAASTQERSDTLERVGAIESLKQVARLPTGMASEFASQALQVLGIQTPRPLSQYVSMWTTNDTVEWIRQIEFGAYEDKIRQCKIDGDLLLSIDEDSLKQDLAMTNGIVRRRFMRELNRLRAMADYAYCDTTRLAELLAAVDPCLKVYTYQMLMAGIDRNYIRNISDDQLYRECGIRNSIHRLKILQSLQDEGYSSCKQARTDCFISYRRSNGSQLASLLKVHLELKGLSVFIDVERLEAGKFDHKLIDSIRETSNFVLVLTADALDRCIDDKDDRDWIRKEIKAALDVNCNIIPIMHNFNWPDPDILPEDMRQVCKFNAVQWCHEYQEACVSKILRFLN